MKQGCLKLKVAVLSRWLALEPAVPRLSVRCTSDALVCSFAYATPSVYNSRDEFELQAGRFFVHLRNFSSVCAPTASVVPFFYCY